MSRGDNSEVSKIFWIMYVVGWYWTLLVPITIYF